MNFINEYIKQQKNIARLISEGKLIVDDIPLYTNLKFDLKDLIKQYSNMIDIILVNEKYPEDIICSLSSYLSNSQSTFISPAYFLNNYIDILTEYTIKYLNKETNLEDDELFKNKSTINIQNIFISMKCLLDRLVPIISYYYKGISLSSTFGRIKENNKPSGLMGRVVQDKENDELFKYIYKQYDEWIKYIVVPRDIVMHYNDMGVREHFTVDNRIIIFHVENIIFDKEKNKNDVFNSPTEHYYKSIAKQVKQLYEFYEIVFSFLKYKDIVYTKHHFKSEDFYKKYIDIQNTEVNTSENKVKVKCKGCRRKPEEINEYIISAAEEEITPTQYVIENEGTYNKVTDEFFCTECYVKEEVIGKY